MLEAAHLWPLPGLREVVPVLPGRPPVRAHDDSRLVVPHDERLDARTIGVGSVAGGRAARRRIGGTRGDGTHGPDCNGPDCKNSNRASTHRHGSRSLKMDPQHIATAYPAFSNCRVILIVRPTGT